MLNRRTLLKEIITCSIIPKSILIPDEEKEDVLLVKLHGFQDCGKPNLNGRIYSKQVLENSFKSVSEIGSFYNGDDDYRLISETIELFRTSHIVKDVHMEENNCVAEIKVLNTPFGIRLKNLIKDNLVLFAPKGTGQLDSKGNVSDYKLISIDAIRLNQTGLGIS